MRASPLISALGALAIAAGCGGDGSDDGRSEEKATTPASSGAAFVERADRICASYQAANARLAEESDNSSPAQIAESTARAEALIERRLLPGLRELTPPAGDGDVIAEFVSLIERQAQFLHRISAAAEVRDGGRVRRALARLDRVRARTQVLADDYGFEVCGPPSEGDLHDE
jgi:hypothetical protein